MRLQARLGLHFYCTGGLEMKQIDGGGDGRRHGAAAHGCRHTTRVTRLPRELGCLQYLVRFRTPLRVNRHDETSFNFLLTSGQGMKAVLEWRCKNRLGPDPSMKHKGSDWLRLGSSFSTENSQRKEESVAHGHMSQTEGKSEMQF